MARANCYARLTIAGDRKKMATDGQCLIGTASLRRELMSMLKRGSNVNAEANVNANANADVNANANGNVRR